MIPVFEIAFWHWYALALVFLLVEMLLPGFLFVWLALGSVVAGTVLAAVPALTLPLQAVVFAVASGLSVFAGWRFAKRVGHERAAQGLNQRGDVLVGSLTVLIEPLANGHGRVRIGDTSWAVTGPELPLGARVRIVGVDGASLRVEPA